MVGNKIGVDVRYVPHVPGSPGGRFHDYRSFAGIGSTQQKTGISRRFYKGIWVDRREGPPFRIVRDLGFEASSGGTFHHD